MCHVNHISSDFIAVPAMVRSVRMDVVLIARRTWCDQCHLHASSASTGTEPNKRKPSKRALREGAASPWLRHAGQAPRKPAGFGRNGHQPESPHARRPTRPSPFLQTLPTRSLARPPAHPSSHPEHRADPWLSTTNIGTQHQATHSCCRDDSQVHSRRDTCTRTQTHGEAMCVKMLQVRLLAGFRVCRGKCSGCRQSRHNLGDFGRQRNRPSCMSSPLYDCRVVIPEGPSNATRKIAEKVHQVTVWLLLMPRSTNPSIKCSSASASSSILEASCALREEAIFGPSSDENRCGPRCPDHRSAAT